jgi:hypothetical protein
MALVRTDFSEERIISNIMVVPRPQIAVTLTREAKRSSEAADLTTYTASHPRMLHFSKNQLHYHKVLMGIQVLTTV